MSRIVTGDGVEAYERWDAPAVEPTSSVPGAGHGRVTGRLTTAGDVERLHKQAYEEGFGQGYQAGLEQGRAALESKASQLDALLKALGDPIRELDNAMVEVLVHLAGSIAKQLVRHELAQDPTHLVSLVGSAFEALPPPASKVQVRLNPDDAALVREALHLDDSGSERWQVVEDPIIEQGDCKLISDASRIDASLDARVTNIVAHLLSSGSESDERS